PARAHNARRAARPPVARARSGSPSLPRASFPSRGTRQGGARRRAPRRRASCARRRSRQAAPSPCTPRSRARRSPSSEREVALQERAHRLEAAPVDVAGTLALQRREVLGRRVALVLGEAVARIARVERAHLRVA